MTRFCEATDKFRRSILPTERTLSCYAVVVFVITFVILGLSVSVSGPSIIFLEEVSYTWEDEVTLIFTGRSVGALGGWLLSIALLAESPQHSAGLLGYGIFGLTIVNFTIGYVRHVWCLMSAFALQGCFLIMTAQACLMYVMSKGGTSRKLFHQLLVFSSLIGCAIAPILMIPLTCEMGVTSDSNLIRNVSKLSHLVSSNSSLIQPLRDINVPRRRRSINESHLHVMQSGLQSESMMNGTTVPNTHRVSFPPSSERVFLTGSSTQDTLVVKTSQAAKSNSLLNPTIGETSTKDNNSQMTTNLPNYLPKKPLVVDAAHLSQDRKTADGSKTATTWKEVDDADTTGRPKISSITHFNKYKKATDYDTTTAKLPQTNNKIRLRVEEDNFLLSNVINQTVKPSALTTPRIETVTQTVITQPQTIPDNITTVTQLKNVATTNMPKLVVENLTKPSVVDAMHLNQDHKSADGSETAAKMKQVDETVRQAEAEEAALEEEKADVNLPSGQSLENPVTKPSFVDAVHLNQDHKSADGSDTAAKMKAMEDDARQKDPQDISVDVSDSVRLSLLEANSSGIRLTPERTLGPIFSGENNVTSDDQTNLTASFTSDDLSLDGEESNLRSNDSYSLHSSYNRQWNRFMPNPWNHQKTRDHYVKSVQRVYLALGLLTLIAWFITLPFTGFFKHVRLIFDFCCCCFSWLSCPPVKRLPLDPATSESATNPIITPAENVPSTSLIDVDGVVDVVETDDAIYSDLKVPSQSTTSEKSVTWVPQFTSETDGIRQVVSVPNFQVLRSRPSSLPNDRSLFLFNSSVASPNTYASLLYTAEPAIWPKITFPKHFWIFVAAFLFSGLETTYAAFLHSFTLRTLHWTPYDALWVTAVFWTGDVLGRLFCTCLGPNVDMGVNLLQGAVNLPYLRKPKSSSEQARRRKINKIAIIIIRTAGALICVVSSGMLKHFTKAYYVYQHSLTNTMLEMWNFSTDRATWIGSFGIGLGLGIVGSSGLSVCNRLGQRLHLAALLGQMVLPAVAGYITERMLHKNASQTLGRTSLILSMLMFFALMVDVVLRLIRRCSWWKSFTQRFYLLPDAADACGTSLFKRRSKNPDRSWSPLKPSAHTLEAGINGDGGDDEEQDRNAFIALQEVPLRHKFDSARHIADD